jgi:hypothetical protein
MLEIGVVPKQGTAGLGRFFPFTGMSICFYLFLAHAVSASVLII